MTILSFDPGATTGVALYKDEHIQTSLCKDLISVWNLLNNIQPDIILFENFALYAHKAKAQIGNEFPSSQVIGVIKLYQALHPTAQIYKQPASAVKQLVKDKDLQDLLCYSDSPHTRDATRHLCYWLITAATDSPIRISFRSLHSRLENVT